MGEMAQMMTSGQLCEMCGQPLDSDENTLHDNGTPSYCDESCARKRGADWWIEANNE